MTEYIYALVRCSDGRWLLLNRHYKPFGICATAGTWFEYDNCDGIRVWLRERDLQQLDGGADRYRAGDRMVWLFDDSTAPCVSAATLRAYRRRVAVLDVDDEKSA